MKKVICLFAFLLLAVLLPLPCAAAGGGAVVDTSRLKVPAGIRDELQGIKPENPDSLTEYLKPAKLFGVLFSGFGKTVRETAGEMLKLLAAVFLFTFAREIMDSLQSKAVVPAFSILSVLCITGLLYASLSKAYGASLSAMQDVTAFGQSLTLVMSTAVAATGGITSASAISLTVSVLSSGFMNFLSRALVPVLNTYFALLLAQSVSASLNIASLTKLVKSVIMTALGIFTTFAVAILSMQKMISSASDSLVVAATKLALGSIPVVGGVVKDTTGTLINSVGVVKTSAGVFGIVVVLLLLLTPLLTAFSYSLLLRLIGALCGIFDQSKVTSLIQGVSSIWDILIAVMLAQGVFAVISAAVMIKAGGGM